MDACQVLFGLLDLHLDPIFTKKTKGISMNTKLFFSAGVGAALLIFVFSSFVSPASGYSEPIIKEVSYFGEDFSTGSGNGFAISAAGLSLQAEVFTTIYTSPEIKAPIPFNAVVPQWLIDLPEEGTFELFIRTKPDGSLAGDSAWSEWTDVHTHDDWTLPDEPLQVGDMLTVPETDGRHTHLQYRLVMGRYNPDTAVTLNRLTFTLIDSTAGPTVAEMMAQQQAIDSQKANRPANGSYPRPSIISRQVWCLSDDCDYSEGLEYQNASHMVIHHTVSSNDSADWAATVRAIWSFHTYSREWGDIGYNYLVDQDGIIYEGHLNEDYETLDVAGTHAAGANRGGMGVALLGTFTEPEHAIPGIEPPAVMIDSLVDLLSWKADQRQIDVFDATDSLPDVAHGLPHLNARLGNRIAPQIHRAFRHQASAVRCACWRRMRSYVSATSPPSRKMQAV